MGVLTILLAALLLCLTAYFENWGDLASTKRSNADVTAPAPTTEDPSYFEDNDIPSVFQEYATLHNAAIASPRDAKYVLYEIPGNTTLAQSVIGLVRGECQEVGVHDLESHTLHVVVCHGVRPMKSSAVPSVAAVQGPIDTKSLRCGEIGFKRTACGERGGIIPCVIIGASWFVGAGLCANL